MARMNGKNLGIGVVLGVTFVLVAGGLFGLVKSATSQTSVAGAPGATTIEGSATAGAPVGAAVPTDEAVAECEFSDWVGKSSAEAESRAKATGRPYRILPPGSAMTMDFRADRINVELNDSGTVTKVSCG